MRQGGITLPRWRCTAGWPNPGHHIPILWPSGNPCRRLPALRPDALAPRPPAANPSPAWLPPMPRPNWLSSSTPHTAPLPKANLTSQPAPHHQAENITQKGEPVIHHGQARQYPRPQGTPAPTPRLLARPVRHQAPHTPGTRPLLPPQRLPPAVRRRRPITPPHRRRSQLVEGT